MNVEKLTPFKAFDNNYETCNILICFYPKICTCTKLKLCLLGVLNVFLNGVQKHMVLK